MFYKIYDELNNYLGMATSASLRYYGEASKKILCCTEEKAQYILLNEVLYRTPILQKEAKELEGKYPIAHLRMGSEEEYEKYMKQKENENLV